jgi:hypothetical protein
MGNRGGAIHNQNRQIIRQYASKRWITCLLEFKGRSRSVMSSGRYTELCGYFLTWRPPTRLCERPNMELYGVVA